jgi:hypothetical protein
VPADADGQYALTVLLTDTATNTSLPGTSPVVDVDTMPPPAVVLTVAPRSPGRARGAEFHVELGDAGGPDRVPGRAPADRSAGGHRPACWATCAGGTVSQPLTGLADGAVTLSLRSVDALGNTSGATTSTVVLDTTKPGTPVVTGTSGAGQLPSARWTWTTPEQGLATECQLRRTGSTEPAWESCTSGQQWALSADGYWTLQVRFTDAAGNASDPGVSPTYELDRVRPEAPRSPGRSASATTRPPAGTSPAKTARSCAARWSATVSSTGPSTRAPAP